jgi:hypothetical protein
MRHHDLNHATINNANHPHFPYGAVCCSSTSDVVPLG